MSLRDQIIISGLFAAIACGYFCVGRLWEMRNRMKYWQAGFDAAEKSYRSRP